MRATTSMACRVLAVVAILAAGLFVPPVMHPAVAAGGLSVEATIPAAGSSQIFLDPGLDPPILYEVGSTVRFIRAEPPYDVLATVPFPGNPAARPGEVGGVVDTERHLLYFLGSTGRLNIIDGSTRTVRAERLNFAADDPLMNAGFGQPQGISWDKHGQRLYVILSTATGKAPQVSVFALDPVSCLDDPGCKANGAGLRKWRYDVNGCAVNPKNLGNIPGASLVPERNELYLACTTTGVLNMTGPRPTQGVMQVHLPANGGPPSGQRFTPVPGDWQFGGVAFDPVSERLLLLSRDFGPAGAFIYDGPHSLVIGILKQSGNVSGVCINADTGRFYVNGDAHLAVGELRATPAQAGALHAEFLNAATGTPRAGPLVCDGARGRLFVPYERDGQPVYLVLRDANPRFVPQPETNPDSFTRNVPDDPTKSLASYSVSGRAFGARVTQVGGIEAYTKSWTTTDPYGSLNFILSNFGPATGSPHFDADRQVVLGQVAVDTQPVALSNSGTQAAATAGTRDPASIDHFTGNGSRDDPWPFAQVDCSDSGSRDGTTKTAVGAVVRCLPNGTPEDPRPRSTAEAGRGETALSVPGVVEITGATATVDLWVDPESGATAEARAAAQRVSIGGGEIVLSDVEAVATSRARGLPGTAKASYVPRIGSLTIGGETHCAPCSVGEVSEAVHSASDGAVEVLEPHFNEALAQGTEQGAAAAIQRDVFEQLNDQALNSMSVNDQQVPALRLAVQVRGYQQNVTLVDLAAPQVSSFRALAPCPFCGVFPSRPPTPTPPRAGSASVTPPTRPTPSPVPVVGHPDVLPVQLASVTPAPPAAFPAPNRSVGLGAVPGIIARGLVTLFTDPGKLPMVLAVWTVLALPVYLSSRRRLVLLRQGR